MIDAGATEMVAVPGAVCWLVVVLLVAPVSPMQPEVERIAINRKTRAAAEPAFRSAELPCLAPYIARRNRSYVVEFFIAAIVSWHNTRGYCSNGHLKYREKPGPPHRCGSTRRATAADCLRPAERTWLGSGPGLRDGHRNFVRESALHSAGVHGGNHVEIRLARLHSRVHVGGRCDR